MRADEVISRPFAKAVQVARKNAQVRSIAWSLTPADINEVLVAGPWKCAVSGLPFDYGPVKAGRRRPWAPSLDRIDSARGYEAGNVRFVCVAVNLAMNEWGESALLRIARAVVRRAGPREAVDLTAEREAYEEWRSAVGYSDVTYFQVWKASAKHAAGEAK